MVMLLNKKRAGNCTSNYYDRHKRNQEARRFYKSTAWRKCREITLARDNYLCQECLKHGKITTANVVHHIKPLEDYPEFALDARFHISLCHACHNKEHPEKGSGKQKQINRKIKVVESKPNREMI